MWVLLLCLSALPCIFAQLSSSPTWAEETGEDILARLSACNSLSHIVMFKTLGIEYKPYKWKTYKGSKFGPVNMEEEIDQESNLTRREQNEIARNKYPEFKNEIDEFLAYTTMGDFVYLYAIRNWLSLEQQCYETKEEQCQVPDILSRKEIVYWLYAYWDMVDDIVVNYGNKTIKEFKKLQKLLDSSKLLSLKYDYKYVQEEVRKATLECKKEVCHPRYYC